MILIGLTILTAEGRAATNRWGLSESWTGLAGLLPLLVSLGALILWTRAFPVPETPYRTVLYGVLPVIQCGILGLWFLVTLSMPGSPAPLPRYIPVLSPLDIQQAFCAALILVWHIHARRIRDVPALKGGPLFVLGDILVFLWITAIIARCVHFYGGVSWPLVIHAGAFNLAFFIFLALWGIGHIIAGHKRALRPAWLAGAVLTVADLVKLLLIDLAQAGTMARIISFFIAGVVLLFIGWAAPLPPTRQKSGG
jgi:uncharacterized membrane protein